MVDVFNIPYFARLYSAESTDHAPVDKDGAIETNIISCPRQSDPLARVAVAYALFRTPRREHSTPYFPKLGIRLRFV